MVMIKVSAYLICNDKKTYKVHEFLIYSIVYLSDIAQPQS